eukprot:16450_1
MTNKINFNDEHEHFDADDDGKLSANELAEACSISLEDAQNIIAQYDADGDGMLDPQEFENLKQQVLQQQRQNMTNKMSHNAFHDNMDENNDGKLSAVELAEACNITQQEAKNIIAQYDVDGDGMLDAQEFENLKQQILQQQRQNMTNKMSANDNMQSMDDNNDGKLSAVELAEACNISQIEASNMIEQYDANNDGYLDAQEFEQLKQQILQQQRNNVTDSFNKNTSYQQMDDNKDGKVSADELSKACNITLNEAQLLIQQNDNDGDGFLDEQEFENLKNKILREQQEKQRAEQLQKERQQRQTQQQQQYNNQPQQQQQQQQPQQNQQFKHKWKLGMNFDPKNDQVVIYMTDEVTNKNWGITLTKQNFGGGGTIRQEYRKLGDTVSNGKITYSYPQYDGGALGVKIEKGN